MKVVTWNVNSIKARIEHVVRWLEVNKPDVVMLQELKCEESKFPHLELNHLGYNIALSCQKTYNGVAIFSKVPIDEVITNFPNNPDPEQARYIEIAADTACGYSRFISVYIPNGGEVNSDKFAYKLKFYDAFKEHLKQLNNSDEHLYIGGDYNVAPFDIDVYDAKHLKETTCFTQIEKEKLRSILNNGFFDAYRTLHPATSEFTWWDYRGNGYTQNKGMRIDHILLNSKAANKLYKCYIDDEERKAPKASDHAPLICEFNHCDRVNSGLLTSS